MLESLTAKVPFKLKVVFRLALIAMSVYLTVLGFQSAAPLLAGVGWLVVSIMELGEMLKAIGQHLMFQRIQKVVMAEIDKEGLQDAVDAFDSAFGPGLRKSLGEAAADLDDAAEKKDSN